MRMFLSIKSILIFGALVYSVVDGSINLALSKPTRQSSTITPAWTSAKAVDGNRNPDVFFHSCAHTDIGYTSAWWQVDMGIIATISNIQIYYRENFGKRLLGFYLFVSNSSDWTKGELCYQHEGQRIPSTFQNITCTVTGRYVTVYNFRNQTHVDWGYESEAYLELCEVEVYGCPSGFYGNECDLHCSDKCIGDICNPDSAECILGCNGGWAGTSCNECKSGTYGLNCTVKCGHCKENTGCYQISGACEEGCKDGWISPNCTQCRPGRHGSLCTEKCGNCFGNTSCDVISGVCLQGCEYGYTGQHCKQRIDMLNEVNCDMYVDSLVGLLSFLVLLMVLSAIALILVRKLHYTQKAENKNDRLDDNIYVEADDITPRSDTNCAPVDEKRSSRNSKVNNRGMYSSAVDVGVCSDASFEPYLYPMDISGEGNKVDVRHSYLPRDSKCYKEKECLSAAELNVCSGEELEQYLYSLKCNDSEEIDISEAPKRTIQNGKNQLKRNSTLQSVKHITPHRLTNLSLPAKVTMIPSNSDEYLEMTGKTESVNEIFYLNPSNNFNQEKYVNMGDSEYMN